ncbi:MAG: branched-chain amino acid transport system II carrier protein [Oscillospiraceae bacterium]
MKKNTTTDIFVLGFALFAMFFGAGNLIFPPYLGFGSASNWFWGFVAFIATDIGLSVLALLMIAKKGQGADGITNVLGQKCSTLLLVANMICLGPLIAIPRTAATTFEFAVAPIFPSFINSWVSAIIFFLIVIALSLKQSKIIDIVGAILSPIMLIALALLIIKGVLSPLGTPGSGTAIDSVLKEGIKAGYQTMDMMGATILSVTLLASINEKGYKGKNLQFKMITLSGLVAAAGLFCVYCGLAFLGASVSTVFPANLSQAELLIAITKGILGQEGIILLGIIVMAACLTTAIGLVSSTATYFSDITDNKLNYKTMVIVISIVSCVLSNLGISTIINFASPILDLIYPILVVLTFMAIFSEKIKNNNIYKGAALGALITSILGLIETYAKVDMGLSRLPFSVYGFSWILPGIVGGFIGYFIKSKKQITVD